MSNSDAKEYEDIFHSSYRIFLNAVTMLAASPDEQCRLMGDYNVAWELKDDVAAGQYLIGQGYLNQAQEAWVGALVGALAIANTSVLSAGPGRDVNIKAMSSVCWEPLRFIAAEVLNQLAPISQANADYLGLNHAT